MKQILWLLVKTYNNFYGAFTLNPIRAAEFQR